MRLPKKFVGLKTLEMLSCYRLVALAKLEYSSIGFIRISYLKKDRPTRMDCFSVVQC